MKYFKKLAVYLVAITILAGGFMITPSTAVHAASGSGETFAPSVGNTGKTTNNSHIKKKYKPELTSAEKLQKWLNVCRDVGMTLKKKGFHYSNSGTRKTLAKAIRSGRKCNCALYVSWCLQEYGAIKKGKTFYVKGSGSLSKKLGKKVRVIRVYKSAKHAHLKPGDVVCFTTPHACIYAGKSKHGKNLWFDQGKIATYGNSDGARYKSYGARKEGYLNDRTVSYIVRIKDLK